MDALTLLKPPRLLCGVDLGQMSDPTALVIAERQMILGPKGQLEPRFLVRFLERVPLRTPYPTIVRGVRARLTALGEACVLILDATGVGRGVVDMFKEPVADDVYTLERQQHPTWRLPRRLHPVAISFTAGTQVRQEPGQEWHVPKRDIIMQTVVAMQQGRIWISDALPDGPVLAKEASNFQWKPSKQLDDEYSAWRDGVHDDLLLALAIVVWWGTRYAPTQTPGERSTHAIPPGNPVMQRVSGRTVRAAGRR